MKNSQENEEGAASAVQRKERSFILGESQWPEWVSVKNIIIALAIFSVGTELFIIYSLTLSSGSNQVISETSMNSRGVGERSQSVNESNYDGFLSYHSQLDDVFSFRYPKEWTVYEVKARDNENPEGLNVVASVSDDQKDILKKKVLDSEHFSGEVPEMFSLKFGFLWKDKVTSEDFEEFFTELKTYLLRKDASHQITEMGVYRNSAGIPYIQFEWTEDKHSLQGITRIVFPSNHKTNELTNVYFELGYHGKKSQFRKNVGLQFFDSFQENLYELSMKYDAERREREELIVLQSEQSVASSTPLSSDLSQWTGRIGNKTSILTSSVESVDVGAKKVRGFALRLLAEDTTFGVYRTVDIPKKKSALTFCYSFLQTAKLEKRAEKGSLVLISPRSDFVHVYIGDKMIKEINIPLSSSGSSMPSKERIDIPEKFFGQTNTLKIVISNKSGYPLEGQFSDFSFQEGNGDQKSSCN